VFEFADGLLQRSKVEVPQSPLFGGLQNLEGVEKFSLGWGEAKHARYPIAKPRRRAPLPELHLGHVGLRDASATREFAC
jgi:hypothetical protein